VYSNKLEKREEKVMSRLIWLKTIALWLGIAGCLLPLFSCDVLAAPSYKSGQAAATGAVNYTFTAEDESWVQEVRLHLGAVGQAGNLVIFVDRVTGPSYDVVYVTQDMTSTQNFVYQPVSPIVLQAGDALRVTWVNASNIGYGLEVVYTKGWTR